MEEAGLIEPVWTERGITIEFPACGKLVPPVVAFTDVAFSYSGEKKDYLYTKLNVGLDSDSRVALVPPTPRAARCLGRVRCPRTTLRERARARAGPARRRTVTERGAGRPPPPPRTNRTRRVLHPGQVGPNGAGKSTLLKLMCGTLSVRPAPRRE
jgi:hypothetical protein